MRGFPKVHLEQIYIGGYTKAAVEIMLRIAADRLVFRHDATEDDERFPASPKYRPWEKDCL